MRVYREFRNTFEAKAARKKLTEHKIEARMVVDPLSSYFPALAHIDSVALEMPSDQASDADQLLVNQDEFRKAG